MLWRRHKEVKLKKYRRLISVLISVALMLGLAIPAVAANDKLETNVFGCDDPEEIPMIIPIFVWTTRDSFSGVQFDVSYTSPGIQNVEYILPTDQVFSNADIQKLDVDLGGSYCFGFFNRAIKAVDYNIFQPEEDPDSPGSYRYYVGSVSFDYVGDGRETLMMYDSLIARVIGTETKGEMSGDTCTYIIERESCDSTAIASRRRRSSDGYSSIDPLVAGSANFGDDTPPAGATDIVKPFINGFPDGTVQPDGPLTRAQLAQIFYNLYAEGETGFSATYPDIKPSHWAYTAVAFCQELNYMIGYPDGLFRPDEMLTRAELCTAILRVAKMTQNETASFDDVVNHWASGYIGALYSAGFVSGYPDGTFKPDNTVTRAEAVAIICRVLERNYLLFDEFRKFPDLIASYWAYEYMMHAANGYNYYIFTNGVITGVNESAGIAYTEVGEDSNSNAGDGGSVIEDVESDEADDVVDADVADEEGVEEDVADGEGVDEDARR